MASCWSSILIILTRFSLKDNKKLALLSTLENISGVENAISGVVNTTLNSNTTSQMEKISADGIKATLEVIRTLLILLIKFCKFF